MHLVTWVILPNKDVGVGGFFGTVPEDFKLRWSKKSSADVFDNQ